MVSERPDYQKAIALVSAPGESIVRYIMNDSTEHLAGAWLDYYLTPPVGYIDEVLALVVLGATAGTTGSWLFQIQMPSGGNSVFTGSTAWDVQLKFQYGKWGCVHLATYPQPSSDVEIAATLRNMIATNAAPLRIRWKNGTDAATSTTRYLDFIVRRRAVG